MMKDMSEYSIQLLFCEIFISYHIDIMIETFIRPNFDNGSVTEVLQSSIQR